MLLCKRNIEPRYGKWKLPAGFMEMSETVAEGAAHETLEHCFADRRNGNFGIHILDIA